MGHFLRASRPVFGCGAGPPSIAALGGRWGQVAEALAEGRVNEPQAAVIVRALDELPAGLDPELMTKAEAHMVSEAAHFDPRRLRVLGRRILEVIAPDLAEEHERSQLEAEEARARRLTELTMRRRGDGTTEIHARVADAVAGRLRTYLDAYAAPRRGDTPGAAPRAGVGTRLRRPAGGRPGRRPAAARRCLDDRRGPPRPGVAHRPVAGRGPRQR